MDQELIILLDEFINMLDNDLLIKEIKNLKNKIKNNPEITKLLQNNDEIDNIISYRRQLFNYKEVKEYLLKENELNILILSINQRLKELIDKKGCLK